MLNNGGIKFITLDGVAKHTDDWGLMLLEPATVKPPEVQTIYITVPGKDGVLDYTEALDGNVHYNSRKFTATLYLLSRKWEDFKAMQMTVSNFLHGRRLRAITDDDSNWYWEGRFEAEDPQWSDAGYSTINIVGSVDPYKYSLATSMGDWLWDPFVFETDIAWDYGDIAVDGTTEVIVATANMPTTPIFRLSAAMTMTVNGTAYNLPAGDSTVPGLVLTDSDTTFTFTGSGTVTIGFRGGSL